jgi:hypothetical protein
VPHLKFTRDHRGYENTFLVETVRRRGREHSRVLYWFRTPPQVKVGRAAIDEGAIRALEDAFPDVLFDWTRILEARPPEPAAWVDEPRRRPRGRTREREAPREARSDRQTRFDVPAVPPIAPASVESSESSPVRDERVAAAAAPLVPEAVEQPLVVLEEPVELLDEDGSLLEGEGMEAGLGVGRATEPSAAERLLGSEGLLRLRARHGEVCARIASQVPDPSRQEALRTLAEGLNPDAWVTEPDVRGGLENFEQVLDQIRREVGPLRKRTRRGGRRNRRRRDGQLAGPAPDADAGSSAERDDRDPLAEDDEPEADDEG